MKWFSSSLISSHKAKILVVLRMFMEDQPQNRQFFYHFAHYSIGGGSDGGLEGLIPPNVFFRAGGGGGLSKCTVFHRKICKCMMFLSLSL